MPLAGLMRGYTEERIKTEAELFFAALQSDEAHAAFKASFDKKRRGEPHLRILI